MHMCKLKETVYNLKNAFMDCLGKTPSVPAPWFAWSYPHYVATYY